MTLLLVDTFDHIWSQTVKSLAYSRAYCSDSCKHFVQRVTPLPETEETRTTQLSLLDFLTTKRILISFHEKALWPKTFKGKKHYEGVLARTRTWVWAVLDLNSNSIFDPRLPKKEYDVHILSSERDAL